MLTTSTVSGVRSRTQKLPEPSDFTVSSHEVTLRGDGIDIDRGAADDVDGFLSCLLRSADLLFRVRPTRWLVVLPVAESEIVAFRGRMKKVRDAENRNRLAGPLSEIRLNVLGSWRVTKDFDEILNRLSIALEPAELVYA